MINKPKAPWPIGGLGYHVEENEFGIIIRGMIPLTAMIKLTKQYGKKGVIAACLCPFYNANIVIAKSNNSFSKWKEYVDFECSKMPPEQSWLKGTDVGASSKSLFLALNGLGAGKIAIPADEVAIPHDADDIGRCFRMLECFPDLKEGLDRLPAKYPQWKNFIESWSELRVLYDDGRFSELTIKVKTCSRQDSISAI